MTVTVPLLAAMFPLLVLVYGAGFVGGWMTREDGFGAVIAVISALGSWAVALTVLAELTTP